MALVAAVAAGGLEGGQVSGALAAQVAAPPAQHAARLRPVLISVVVRAAALRPARHTLFSHMRRPVELHGKPIEIARTALFDCQRG